MQRASGTDATFLHMERTGPTHTLKVLILDTTQRGRPVAIEEFRAAAGWLVARLPRLRQVVRFAPLFSGLPFWVDAPDVDLDRHLDEQTVASDAEFDALLGDLAGRLLPRDRPLWSATLVHGLSGGRQAVAICVSHAIADGLASMNCLTRLTAAEPGGAPTGAPPPLPPPASPPADHQLLAAAGWDLLRRTLRTRRVLRTSRAGSRQAKRFRRGHDMPNVLAVKPNYLTTRFDNRRSCARIELPLEEIREIGKATGLTVNCVLHAVISGALRAESEHRGFPDLPPMIATFGIASDATSDRLAGNHVDVTFVNLHTDVEDPVERLQQVGRSTVDAVELRRAIGLGSQDDLMDYVARLPSLIIVALNRWLTAGHLVTANVRGPAERRWIGDVQVADWVSYAIIVPPYSVNLTTHSYAGAMNVGLMTHPDVMPHPEQFLDRLAVGLRELAAAVRTADPLVPTSLAD